MERSAELRLVAQAYSRVAELLRNGVNENLLADEIKKIEEQLESLKRPGPNPPSIARGGVQHFSLEHNLAQLKAILEELKTNPTLERTARLDAVADKLQDAGLVRLAAMIDSVSNSL